MCNCVCVFGSCIRVCVFVCLFVCHQVLVCVVCHLCAVLERRPGKQQGGVELEVFLQGHLQTQKPIKTRAGIVCIEHAHVAVLSGIGRRGGHHSCVQPWYFIWHDGEGIIRVSSQCTERAQYRLI